MHHNFKCLCCNVCVFRTRVSSHCEILSSSQVDWLRFVISQCFSVDEAKSLAAEGCRAGTMHVEGTTQQCCCYCGGWGQGFSVPGAQERGSGEAFKPVRHCGCQKKKQRRRCGMAVLATGAEAERHSGTSFRVTEGWLPKSCSLGLNHKTIFCLHAQKSSSWRLHVAYGVL